MSQIKVNSIVPQAGLPTGASGGIVQVKSTTKTDTFTTTSTSYTDITGLSVEITPVQSSAKILLLCSADYGNDGNQSCRISIFNGSTNLFGSAVSNRLRGWQLYVWGDTNTSEQFDLQHVDSPSYTLGDTITYKLRMALQGSTGTINRSGSDADNSTYGYRSASSITAMELSV